MKTNAKKKKLDKRTFAVRVVCLILAGLMVLGGAAYAISVIIG